MFIQVVCQNPAHTGRSRAKRRFDNGAVHRMEVIDRAEDFYTDATKTFGDMTKINRAGYDALKRDPVFSVLADNETSSTISSELLEAVKRQAAATAAELSTAQATISQLTLEGASKDAEISKLRLEIEALVEAATKPADPVEPSADAKATAKKK